MRISPTRRHALAILASALCTTAFATEPPRPTDGSPVIALPQGGVDVSVYDHLVKTVEATLQRCLSSMTPGMPAPVAQPGHTSTPIKTLYMADSGNYYPTSLMLEGHQAAGFVKWLVDAQGNPRFTHLDRAIPNDPVSEFPRAVREMVRDSRFAPATVDARPVARWRYIKVTFLLHDQGGFGGILSDSKLREVLAKARHGDVNAMAVAQYLDSLEPSEVKLTDDEGRSFLVHAALAGYREASRLLVYQLSPIACRQDPEVQDVFHMLSWQSGSKVGLSEATRLMASKDPSTYHDISMLLHGAANATDAFTQMWATGLLATAPIAELRDPAFALQIALTFTNPEQDPDITEVLAAAYAANSQFDDAVRTETLALGQARKRHWNDAQLRQRLASYQSHQPWTDYLCDCDATAVR